MRYNKEMEQIVQERVDKIPFSDGRSQYRLDYGVIFFCLGPIAGIQVRRTDKVGTEAAFHSVKEYMDWVEVCFTN